MMGNKPSLAFLKLLPTPMKPFIRRSLALLAASLAVAAQASVTITTWNTGSGGFANGSNWTDGLPLFLYENPGDNVGVIDNGGTATVTTTLTAPGSLIDTLRVGGMSDSSLHVQSGGQLDAFYVIAGNGASDVGTLTVDGTLRAYEITVGNDGTGTLTIGSSGKVAGAIYVASNSGSIGTLTLLSGGRIAADSEFESDGSLYSGNGDATITLNSGGTVDGDINLSGSGNASATINSGSFTLGGKIVLESSGSASAHLDGTTISPTAFIIGGNGINSLLIDNSANVTTTSTGVSEIGGTGTGTNSITVSGSTWSSSGSLLIGGTGNGTLNISDSATVTQNQVTLGGNESGYGALNVTTGAALTVQNLYIGQANGGAGEVNISESGSDVHATGDFWIGGAGSGSLAVMSGGSMRNGSGAYIGNTGTGWVTVSGTGSKWTSLGDVTIGVGGGSGAITLTDGGVLKIGSTGTGNLYLTTAMNGGGSLNIGADAGSGQAAAGELQASSVSGSSDGEAVVTFNHTSSNYVFAPSITGGVFVAQVAGTTVLSGTNNYNHGTYISGGTLTLGANNAAGSGYINLAGGTLNLNDFDQTSGTLTVSGNSFINFLGTSSLVFADSSSLEEYWSGTLTLLNFGAGDTFQVGTDATGLTTDQLHSIIIDGYYAQISANGYLTAGSTLAIPEPSTYAAIIGFAALGLAAWRRRSQLAVASVNRF